TLSPSLAPASATPASGTLPSEPSVPGSPPASGANASARASRVLSPSALASRGADVSVTSVASRAPFASFARDASSRRSPAPSIEAMALPSGGTSLVTSRAASGSAGASDGASGGRLRSRDRMSTPGSERALLLGGQRASQAGDRAGPDGHADRGAVEIVADGAVLAVEALRKKDLGHGAEARHVGRIAERPLFVGIDGVNQRAPRSLVGRLERRAELRRVRFLPRGVVFALADQHGPLDAADVRRRRAIGQELLALVGSIVADPMGERLGLHRPSRRRGLQEREEVRRPAEVA